MEKTTDYKKALMQKGSAVKRLVKEYDYYAKDAEKAEANLKEAKEQNKGQSEIQKQRNNFDECTGAKKQTFSSLAKFTSELENVLTRIDTNSEEEEAQKAKDEAKGLAEYSNAQTYLFEAKKFLETDDGKKLLESIKPTGK